jgi:cell division protein FtsB
VDGRAGPVGATGAVTGDRARRRAERSRRSPRTGAGAAGARRRPPQLSRSRGRGVVAATTGLLGLSSTKRVAVLAVVVCALALTVAVPLRNYVAQRQELAAVTEQQRQLAAEVDELTRQRARLADPAEVAAQARSRLGYVQPGDIPYVVQFPVDPTTQGADARGGAPWFRVLWREVVEGPA